MFEGFTIPCVLSHDKVAEHAVGARPTVHAAVAFIAAFIQTMPLSGPAAKGDIQLVVQVPPDLPSIQTSLRRKQLTE
jgi:hypothetical protein